MLTIKENTHEEVNKVLNGLSWVAAFWLDKMKAISVEGQMDRKEFKDLRDTGIMFLDSFVAPMITAYEKKKSMLGEETKPEIKPTPEPKKKAVKVNKEEKSAPPVKIDAKTGDNILPTGPILPQLLQPLPTPPAAVQFRSPRKGFRSNMTTQQRDEITLWWIKYEGAPDETKCQVVANDLGLRGPGQVSGWIKYLNKISGEKTYEKRVRGWRSMIGNGLTSDIPVPDFFMHTNESIQNVPAPAQAPAFSIPFTNASKTAVI